MPLSEFDRDNIDEIVGGYGDWFTAHVIRFVAGVYHKADADNKAILWDAYPEIIKAILASRDWKPEAIAKEEQNYGWLKYGSYRRGTPIRGY